MLVASVICQKYREGDTSHNLNYLAISSRNEYA